MECTHCYLTSSPRADQHPLLSLNSFNIHLDDALARNYNKLEIYFTGGEPFINPELLPMFEVALKHGNTTVLTNATRITDSVATQLAAIQHQRLHTLTFRVSLDGPNTKLNDRIRGPQAFKRAITGLKALVNHGFNPIVTVTRLWPETQIEAILQQFIAVLEETGISEENQRLKILPPLRIGREAQRDRPYTEQELFTAQCFADYDYNDLQCSKCRIVSENGVWVCPILINEDGARMGSRLEETTHSFPMTYLACWTCRMDGMSCTNE